MRIFNGSFGTIDLNGLTELFYSCVNHLFLYVFNTPNKSDAFCTHFVLSKRNFYFWVWIKFAFYLIDQSVRCKLYISGINRITIFLCQFHRKLFSELWTIEIHSCAHTNIEWNKMKWKLLNNETGNIMRV